MHSANNFLVCGHLFLLGNIPKKKHLYIGYNYSRAHIPIWGQKNIRIAGNRVTMEVLEHALQAMCIAAEACFTHISLRSLSRFFHFSLFATIFFLAIRQIQKWLAFMTWQVCKQDLFSVCCGFNISICHSKWPPDNVLIYSSYFW